MTHDINALQGSGLTDFIDSRRCVGIAPDQTEVLPSSNQAYASSLPTLKLRKESALKADALISLQKELGDAYEQVASRWVSGVKSEVELWSELGKKVTASRSVPEGLDACRDGVAQRMQMAAEDGRRLFEDGQKVIEAVTRSLSNG